MAAADENDLRHLQASFEVAHSSRKKGNHPFGALLVNEQGQVLMTGENTLVTTGDCTGHAETNLMSKASSIYEPEVLAKCTLYTSTEPCMMCSGAIFWGNVRRVVYALSAERFYQMAGGKTEDALNLSCREAFSRGNKLIEVVGPLLEEEALEVHAGFWT